jgi:hypothetical protein
MSGFVDDLTDEDGDEYEWKVDEGDCYTWNLKIRVISKYTIRASETNDWL